MSTQEAEFNDTSFRFEMFHEGSMVLVTVQLGESGYGIHFNNRLVTELALDEHCCWVDSNGQLDDDTVDEIGRKIENHWR